MDVDDATAVFATEFVRENLHEPCKNDELDVLSGDEFADLGEAFDTIFSVHVDFMKWNIFTFGDAATVWAVTDDGGNFDGEFIKFRAPEDFVEAVVGLGDKHGGFHPVGQTPEMPIRLQGAAERTEPIDEVLGIDVQIHRFNF